MCKLNRYEIPLRTTELTLGDFQVILRTSVSTALVSIGFLTATG